MKTLSIILTLLFLGCSSFYLPEKHMLRKIEQLPSHKKVLNCVDKALMYHNHLNNKGIESRIETGNRVGSDPRKNHAWVIVFKDNKQYFVDPTWDSPIDGFERKSYPEWETWLRYEKKVSKRSDLGKKNIEKYFWKNIPPWFQEYLKK